mmetsp:Transcript_8285/g.25669  ORF Transcript_8285/g.25669 Transcript_8285/m.25669 type:complete len:395 (+) Transcript_8285:904-2088(+)
MLRARIPPHALRSEQTFVVHLSGKMTNDQGGPSLQLLSDLAAELHSPRDQGLPLFVPSRNDQDSPNSHHLLVHQIPSASSSTSTSVSTSASSHQHQRDLTVSVGGLHTHSSLAGHAVFVPNPACSSSYYLALYRRLGNLIGGAMYARANMALSWPLLGWKRLLGEQPTVDDLREVSGHRLQFVLEQAQCTREQRALYNSLPEEEGVWLYWSLQDVVGHEVSLCRGGSTRRLRHEEQADWAAAYLSALLDEGAAQWRAVREGLLAVVPAHSLRLLTAAELRMFVRGASDYSVDHLRANLEIHDDLHREVEWICEYLEEAGARARLEFLRFVTGRDCVPPQAEEWPFTIGVQQHYKYLPVAYTCVSTLYIARCADREEFLRRLRFALASCSDFELG